MWKNLRKRLKNSIIIYGSLSIILIVIFLGYKGYEKYDSEDTSWIYDVPNTSIENLSISEFCSLLEKELNDKRVGDVTEEWKCSVVNETLREYEDVVFNKTYGLCNCSNILENGKPISIQIRKTKSQN